MKLGLAYYHRLRAEWLAISTRTDSGGGRNV